MATVSSSASEDSKDLQEILTSFPDIHLTTKPVMICGVQRKVNIGDYENIDVYAAIAIPLGDVSLEDQDALTEAVKAAAAYGFHLTSSETLERYKVIKESMRNH